MCQAQTVKPKQGYRNNYKIVLQSGESKNVSLWRCRKYFRICTFRCIHEDDLELTSIGNSRGDDHAQHDVEMNVQATKCNFLRALVKWMVFIKVRLFFHHEVIKGSSLKKYTQNQSYVFCFLFFKLNIIFILFIIMDFKKCSKNLFKVDQTTPKPSSL